MILREGMYTFVASLEAEGLVQFHNSDIVRRAIKLARYLLSCTIWQSMNPGRKN